MLIATVLIPAEERGPQSGLGQKRDQGVRGIACISGLSNTRAKIPRVVVKKPRGVPPYFSAF